MCVILDASARDTVFGDNPTVAGRQLRDWLQTPAARLVLGGKLSDELRHGSDVFDKWAETAIADGRIRTYSGSDVRAEAEALEADWSGTSNDQHVIALARVSRARILFAQDGALRDDFRNPALVSNPPGRLFPTGESANAAKHRKQLLRRGDVCPNR